MLAWAFYVQDERYDVMPWMAMNVYVQDERYVLTLPINTFLRFYFIIKGMFN